ncbi:TetR/AcrR family transcriptional regulator [Sphingobium yanoikuyae]|jgi:AcrR family transcriptional regulator|uniref:TetR/AcrR family transcriptional regulator n=1 Tax=Sphingobium yanoikuyae TaxID=13690 RepID=A0A6M4G599_SPHYA|nr:TetR/AcrR family transcriptional regulator [Sphingobium yanoikuyae]QJR02279.1 TetR/AcrR family transcriptional regulator [Sphingobium yanoikuyae]
MEAALRLYGQVGWQGFNLDGVARGANVSKDALYRRWKSRESLLEAALVQRFDWIIAIDNGNIRDDLLTLATRTFDIFAGNYGEVALQLRTDARRFQEVQAFAAPYRELMVLQGRRIVRRALDRGELPAEAKPGLIMDLLIGGITNRIISTPPQLRNKMLANSKIFIKETVDVILSGARLLKTSDS